MVTPRIGRSGVAMDMRHWAYVGDGDYVSIATQVPVKWEQSWAHAPNGPLTYISGDYTIKRRLSGDDRTYTVWREGEELPLAFYGRLSDAKARAVKNAEGRDRMHVA